MNLTDLVTDDTVRVAASLFPAELQIDSAGATGCRVMLMQHPDGGWALGAWSVNPVGGVPNTVLVERVERVVTYVPSKIHVVLVDGRQVIVTPGRGCGSCGGAGSLRMYNPFGPMVSLARVPSPVT